MYHIRKSKTNAPYLIEAEVKLVERAITAMRAALKNCQNITLDELCRESATNATTLTDAFNRVKCQPPMKHWKIMRLEYACELLVGTQFSISEIAIRALHPNAAYFSTAFKQRYKTSPSQYRREFQR